MGFLEELDWFEVKFGVESIQFLLGVVARDCVCFFVLFFVGVEVDVVSLCV